MNFKKSFFVSLVLLLTLDLLCSKTCGCAAGRVFIFQPTAQGEGSVCSWPLLGPALRRSQTLQLCSCYKSIFCLVQRREKCLLCALCLRQTCKITPHPTPVRAEKQVFVVDLSEIIHPCSFWYGNWGVSAEQHNLKADGFPVIEHHFIWSLAKVWSLQNTTKNLELNPYKDNISPCLLDQCHAPVACFLYSVWCFLHVVAALSPGFWFFNDEPRW